MIQATDCIVGRWFNRKHGKGWTWIQLDEGIIGSIFSNSLEYALNDLEPIPITPEILAMAGFKKVGEKPYYSMRLSVNSEDELCWYSQDNELRYQTKGSGFTRLFEPQHLHLLQNLYSAITGEELKLVL